MGPIQYIPCPECGVLMNRRNFGGTSGIIVDVCSVHGTWFDAGELAAVLAFVESGGPVQPKRPEPREPRKVEFVDLVRSDPTPLELGTVARELLAFVLSLLKKR